MIVLADEREALVTARVETGGGSLAALLEVVVSGSPLVTLDGPDPTWKLRETARSLVRERPALEQRTLLSCPVADANSVDDFLVADEGRPGSRRVRSE